MTIALTIARDSVVQSTVFKRSHTYRLLCPQWRVRLCLAIPIEATAFYCPMVTVLPISRFVSKHYTYNLVRLDLYSTKDMLAQLQNTHAH